MSVSIHRIRLPCETKHTARVQDKLTSESPSAFARAPLRIEIAAFYDGDLLPFDNITLLTLDIKAPGNKDGRSYVRKTTSDFDTEVTDESWADNSAQSAVIELTGTEMNLDLEGKDDRSFWLVLTALDSDGNKIPLGTAVFNIKESGNAPEDAPPANDPDYYTSEEADGLFAPIAGAGANTRFQAGKGWQYYNAVTGLWHTLLCTGNPPNIAWDAGEA